MSEIQTMMSNCGKVFLHAINYHLQATDGQKVTKAQAFKKQQQDIDGNFSKKIKISKLFVFTGVEAL